MLKKTIAILPALALILLLASQPADAQYSISKSVFGSGCTPTSNGSYTIKNTIGQPGIGLTQNTSHTAKLGFWYGFGGPAIHLLNLGTGWNMISSYVDPQDPALATMFASLSSSQLYLILNNTNEIYFHSDGSGNLTTWNKTQGYRAYMFQSGSVEVTGSQIRPENTPISLGIGWNTVAYLRTSAQEPAVAFSGLSSSQLYLVLDNTNRIYFHSDGSGNLTSLEPGQGYRMYMFQTGTLTYLANGKAAADKGDRYREPVNLVVADHAPTGNQSVMILDAGNVPDGWELGVYAGETLIGSAVVQNGKALISLRGDNDMTETTEFAREDEILTVKAYYAKEERLIDVDLKGIREITSDSDRELVTYRKDGIYEARAELLENPTNGLTLANYPNPFSASTLFEYSLSQDCDVALDVYSTQGEHIARVVDGRQRAGLHKHVFEAGDIASGVYNVVLTAGGERISKVVVLVK